MEQGPLVHHKMTREQGLGQPGDASHFPRLNLKTPGLEREDNLGSLAPGVQGTKSSRFIYHETVLSLPSSPVFVVNTWCLKHKHQEQSQKALKFEGGWENKEGLYLEEGWVRIISP